MARHIVCLTFDHDHMSGFIARGLTTPTYISRGEYDMVVIPRLVALLGFPAGSKIGPTRALRDLGLDSLLSVSLRNELTAGYGLDLHATLLFDHPTLSALTTHLLQLVDLQDDETALDDLDEAALAALMERELETTR